MLRSQDKMKFIEKNIPRSCQENEIYEDVLSLDGKHILELGCGKAYVSRLIAGAGKDRTLVAMEVDQIQHDLNIKANDTPNIRFVLAGGEDIPEDDEIRILADALNSSYDMIDVQT